MSLAVVNKLCLVLALAGCAATFAVGNQQAILGLTTSERRYLDTLSALSAERLQACGTAFAAERLRQEATRIFELQATSVAGRSAAAKEGVLQEYIRQWLVPFAEQGMVEIGRLQTAAAVPVLDGGQAARLQIGDWSCELLPLWPNGAMPSLCPRTGLAGPLVEVGTGEWEEIGGVDLTGAIALMEFRGGRHWERLFSLGCQAVVVVDDGHLSRHAAEGLFCNTPIPCPRFFADAQTGAALRSRADRQSPPMARLTGGNVYESRIFESLFFRLPPTAPVAYTVAADDLLRRIAADYGVSPVELAQANGLAPGEAIVAGMVLDLPGRLERYQVPAGDLLLRLAADFGVHADVLRQAAGLRDGELAVGSVLSIPVVEEPLTVLVRIDSVCVVPDALHGGKAAADVAVALLLVEQLCQPGVVRRKPLLLGFIDGDSLGGVASRNLAAGQVFGMVEGGGVVRRADETELYREVGERLRRGELDQLSKRGAGWFGERWLAERVEKRRIEIAERRIEIIKAALEGKGRPQAELAAHERDCEAQLQALVGLREATLGNRSLAWPDRLAAFFSRQEEAQAEAALRALELDFVSLARRFVAEAEEVDAAVEQRLANQALLGALNQAMAPAAGSPGLGLWLDLSAGGKSLGIGLGSDGRGIAPPAAAAAGTLPRRFERLAAYAARQAGWSDEWTFASGESRSQFPLLPVERAPSYAEFWASLGIGLLHLTTLNDPRHLLDTPLDTLAGMNFENLAVQARTVAVLVGVGLESPAVSSLSAPLKVPKYGRAAGRTVQFNIRSGIDAQDPVAGAWVYYPAIPKGGYGSRLSNSSTRAGARLGSLQVTGLSGRYAMPLEASTFAGPKLLAAYRLDRQAGVFDQVMDAGQIGTQKQTRRIKFLAGQESEKDLVLTSLYPLVLFPGVDPMTYSRHQGVAIQDALANGVPQHYGLDDPAIDYLEADLAATIVYMVPGRRLRALFESGSALRGLLIGSFAAADDVRGGGIPVGPVAGSRNLSVPVTPLAIAEQMIGLSERRLALYERFGIRDQALSEAIRLGREKLEEAQTARQACQWRECVGAARQAWGTAVKNYPGILRLGREAVFSVVILMAVLVPACLFVERLVIGGKTVLRRLGGAAVLFAVAIAGLDVVHPAFAISVSPFIVVIAFAMILMSCVVLGICYQRFEVLVRRARIRGGEAESEEISLASSLATALSLGVSNLKKRPARTALTAFTVSVLTFSIITFVSVRGGDRLYAKPLAVDLDVEGRRLSATELSLPGHDGVLFRNFNWAGLDAEFVSAIRTEFGGEQAIVARAHYIEVEGGNNADREGANQVAIRHAGRSAVVEGIMAFEPAEKEFSGLQRAVSGEQWFGEGEGDDGALAAAQGVAGPAAVGLEIIIPDRVAEALGITPEMLLDRHGVRRPAAELPVVQMMDYSWRVIGILAVEPADRLRDLNGKSLAMVDYLRSAITPSAGSGRIEGESESYHVSWARLAIVPMSARLAVGAKYRSVAVKFGAGADVEGFKRRVAARLVDPMFGCFGGQVSLFTARKARSVSGLGKVVIPIILCILIVANTMLGTVEERQGEVRMLGAVGLSPAQISFLLLSESTVFSVLGMSAGMFAGLAFSKGVGLLSPGLGGLSLNFTSLASTGLAAGTALVVLLATLVPARRAAALAAPSGMDKWRLPEPEEDGRVIFHLPFTLTRGNAVGMLAFCRRFLLNHSDATSPDFNCRDVQVQVRAHPADAIAIAARMWLAPYDLDVAQGLALAIEPTEHAGVFAVEIVLRRLSGSEEAWLRVNYAFMDLVRQQFLLWRNLEREQRRRFIDEGARLIAECLEGAGAVRGGQTDLEVR